MKNLKECREQKKLTQEQLAKKIGVGRSTVAKWEAGINTPRVKQLAKLSKFFKRKMDYFFSDDVILNANHAKGANE